MVDILYKKTEAPNNIYSNIKYFDTLEDAKKYIDGCKIKHHKI